MAISRVLKTYSIKEAAEILKVTEYTVRRYVREGQIQGHKTNRKILISEDALKEFVTRNDKD